MRISYEAFADRVLEVGDADAAARPIVTRRGWLAILAWVAVWGCLMVASPVRPALRLPAWLVGMAAFAPAVSVWGRSLEIVLERIHLRLLARPELGELPRIVLAVVVGGAYAVATIGTGYAVIAAAWWVVLHS